MVFVRKLERSRQPWHISPHSAAASAPMPILRIDIERALDELASQEEGMRFQGLAVVLGKKRWPELIARQRKKDFGLDAYAPSSLSAEKIGKGLAASITPTLKKISADAKTAKENFPDLKTLLFVTSAKVGNADRKQWEEAIQKEHGLELHIIEREEIITSMMMPENASLLASFLRLDVDVDRIVLDMDSSESPVHGAQEGSAYNGHFESVCYHPLFLFNEHGDCLGATLRPGNVHSAEDWDDLLVPEIERQQAEGSAWRSARTRRSPSRRSTTRSNSATWSMPSASRRTRAWSWRSRTSCFAHGDGRAESPWCGTRVSGIRPRAGPRPDGSSPRSNTIQASCSPASASS
ncbi:MAG: transposase [Acidobacteria bacterium]|nr:transposase [Acidobacteriota bacterium]